MKNTGISRTTRWTRRVASAISKAGLSQRYVTHVRLYN